MQHLTYESENVYDACQFNWDLDDDALRYLSWLFDTCRERLGLPSPAPMTVGSSAWCVTYRAASCLPPLADKGSLCADLVFRRLAAGLADVLRCNVLLIVHVSPLQAQRIYHGAESMVWLMQVLETVHGLWHAGAPDEVGRSRCCRCPLPHRPPPACSTMSGACLCCASTPAPA